MKKLPKELILACFEESEQLGAEIDSFTNKLMAKIAKKLGVPVPDKDCFMDGNAKLGAEFILNTFSFLDIDTSEVFGGLHGKTCH
jgi:hypothetical protein